MSGGRTFTVLRQQLALSSAFPLPAGGCFGRLRSACQIGIQLLALVFCASSKRAPDTPRRLLARAGRGRVSSTSAFRCADSACRADLRFWARALLPVCVPMKALNSLERRRASGLLLRQLVQGVGDFRARDPAPAAPGGSIPVAGCDLQDLLVQRIGVKPGGTWRGSSLRLLLGTPFFWRNSLVKLSITS